MISLWKPIFFLLLLSIVITGVAHGEQQKELDSVIVQELKTIGAQPGSPELLAITNAPYLRDQQGLASVRSIELQTGTSVGSGNLLFFWREKNSPLLIMLFNKQSFMASVIKQNGNSFSTDHMELSLKNVNNPEFWINAVEYQAGKDLSALIPLAHAWSAGVPYDYLKLAELHGDLCPGISAGYIIARYLENNFPLKDDEQYIFIASPAYCKDDAFQMLFGSTAGKKRLIASLLSEEQQNNLTVSNPAGIIIIWNPSDKKGKGLAMSFDFDNVRNLLPDGQNSPKPIMTMAMFKKFNQPEQLVKVAAEFEVDKILYDKMLATGAHPYELIGLVKK